MSLENVRIGVLNVKLPVKTQNIMSALTKSATALVPTVCAVTDSNPLLNDLNSPLASGDTYTFVLALMGEDRVYGGYTVACASDVSTVLTYTDPTDAIRISIPNTQLPSNYEEAAAMAIFVKFLVIGRSLTPPLKKCIAQRPICDIAPVMLQGHYPDFINAQLVIAAKVEYAPC